MKNTLNYSAGAQTLLSNVNDDTNRIIINGTEIPSTDWTGTGTFTYSVEGATISIARISDTSGNIMLQKVDTDSYRLIRKEESSYQTTTGDTKDNVVTFTSADDDSVFNSGNLAGQSAYAWNAVATMASAEKHSSLFNKISTMFKNIRTIAKLLGTTDISSIGGGTISGAINALNVSLANSFSVSTYGGTIAYYKRGNVVSVIGVRIGTSSNVPTGRATFGTLPQGYRPNATFTTVMFASGNISYAAMNGIEISSSGVITTYAYSTMSSGHFIATFVAA